MSHLDLLQYHAFCLTNTGSRLSQYERAIAASVREGDAVLDLGTGSGLLAVLACRAGARRVFAVESSDAIRLGELLAGTTAFAERITFIQTPSSQLVLNERVDVIVGDIHDTFGLQPGGLASLFDARERLLRLGGTIIPRATRLMVAPVEAPAFYAREIDVWATSVHSVNLAPIRPFAVNHVHAGRFDREQLLSSPAPIGVIDFTRATSLHVGGSATLTIQRGWPRSWALRLFRDDPCRRYPDGQCPWRQQYDELRSGVFPLRATGIGRCRRRDLNRHRQPRRSHRPLACRHLARWRECLCAV